MIPTAYISHSTNERLRIKIPEKKCNVPFFNNIQSVFRKCSDIDNLVVNNYTGSILVTAKNIDINRIKLFAKTNQLFDIREKENRHSFSLQLPKPFTNVFTVPIGQVNKMIKQTSNDSLDLAGVFFLSLMSLGIVQALRGNTALPGWHTALWYSFGIYTSTIKPKQIIQQ
jgi:flagellar basal body P-ring protein FlgI